MSDTTTTEESSSAPVDEKRQPLLELLQSELADQLLDSVVEKGDITVRIDRSVWRRTAELCRDRLGMEYFCFLSGIDWLPTDLSGEKAFEPAGEVSPVEPDTGDAEAETGAVPGSLQTGVAGGDTRFQVFARYYSEDPLGHHGEG